MKKHVFHVDNYWICKKMGSHGGGYEYNSSIGLAHIDFITSKNNVQILWYNIILYIKYLKRRIKKVI